MITDLSKQFVTYRTMRYADFPAKTKSFVDLFQIAWRAYPYIKADPINQIDDFIYVGDGEAANDHGLLLNHGITSVFGLAPEIEYDANPNINYHTLHIDDGHVGPIGAFEAAAILINRHVENKQKIFVHCFAGISRSVTAVVSYYMLYQDLSLDEAIEKVRAARPAANPHPFLIWTLIRDFGDRFRY